MPSREGVKLVPEVLEIKNLCRYMQLLVGTKSAAVFPVFGRADPAVMCSSVPPAAPATPSVLVDIPRL
jgi:hypothetical protein